MKKSAKVVIGLIVAVAVIIIGVSLFFPAALSDLTSGTFGKADKYHKTQMTEKDVVLRSDLVADTGQLRGMIQGLIYFSLFTQNLSTTIDSCVLAYNGKGMGNDPVKQQNLRAMQDFSGYIKNNNKTLQNTISMLTGFYLKADADQSADVEKNLRDFGNYVNNLNEKDSVLNHALVSMDGFLLTNKTLKNKKAEIANLKSIRDLLLIGSIQLSVLISDKELSSHLLSYALSSQSGLNSRGGLVEPNAGGAAIRSQNQLGLRNTALANQALNNITLKGGYVQGIQNQAAINSAQLLNEIELFEAQSLGSLKSGQNDLGALLVGSMVVYDKANLSFIICNVSELKAQLSAAELNSIALGSQNLSSVAVFSKEGLNVIIPAYQLSDVINSYIIGSMIQSNVLSNSQLNGFLAHDNLGVIQFGSQATMAMGALQNLNSLH